MRIKKLKRKYFDKANCCVVGLKGTGKDMLFANITARGNNAYVSNTDYHNKNQFIPLDFSKLDVRNCYVNFIEGTVNKYTFPYKDGTDIYIADCGVYMPSQYCNELNKYYKYFPTFFALSRHLGECNVHFNVQNLNRVWDKLREQSDIYIKCESCHVYFHRVVIQTITIYDKYQSCVDRVKPFKPMPISLTAKSENKARYKTSNMEAKRRYDEVYGLVKRRILIYINKSNYDTRVFKTILENGGIINEEVSTKNKRIFQKIKDCFFKVVERLKNAYKSIVRKVQRKIKKRG